MSASDPWLLPASKEQVFLLGWPKAGTSSLYLWLSRHPSIGTAALKETFFFVDKEYPAYLRHGQSVFKDGIDTFRGFFPSEASIWLEATTHHVYQETALRYLTINKDRSRVILLLRDPAARIYSSFQSTKNNFASASKELSWSVYVEALLNNNVSSLSEYYFNKTSFESARRQLINSDYCYWIEKWQNALGQDRVKLILFEELVDDPRFVVKSVLSWLNLDPEIIGHGDFPIANKTLSIRYQALHRVAKRFRKTLPKSALRDLLRSAYLAFQAEVAVDSDPAGALDRLRRHFEPMIEELEETQGLDLSKWKK